MAEGKAHLAIAFGCTGGRHRSVAIAEHLAERYRDDDDLWIEVTAPGRRRRPPSGPEVTRLTASSSAKERTRP